MKNPPQGSGKREVDAARLKAQTIRQKRQREGTWSAGIVPHTAYQTRPLDWIEKYLGVPRETLMWSLHPAYKKHQWDGDKDPLVIILKALAELKDVGVESATGTGKTYLAACITLWFLACFEDSLVPTVAPKENQLLTQIWKEIGKLWPNFHEHFPDALLLTGVLRMKPAVKDKEVWAAWAFVCGVGASEDSATKAQGIHGEHVLFITEETPGIHNAIMNAIYNTRTDDHNLHLALGNPDHQQDELHRFCMDPDVVAIRISALDHPNIVSDDRVVKGAIGKKRLISRTRQLGKGSRRYVTRVRGISPKEAEDALIRWDWCVAAASRFANDAYRVGELALGVDVADSSEGDSASIASFQGACLTDIVSWQVKEDATEVAERVFREATNEENPVDPRFIGIDNVGVGASAVNELKRLGLRVRHIGGGNRAVPQVDTDTLWSVTEPDLEGNIKAKGPKVIEAEEYNNLRSQVWWRMREDLRLGRIALPNDEDLFQDLCAPTYDTRTGKIAVESKDGIKKRLGRSPDKGDAACYGNWVRKRTPIKRMATKAEMEAVGAVSPGPNKDIGLERAIARLNKRQKAEQRRIQRLFRSKRRIS